MRVLYCTDTYPPQVNGVSIVTALSVAGLQRRGWECTVVAPRYPEAVNVASHGGADPASVPVTSLPSIAVPWYPDLRVAIAGLEPLRDVTRRFRPDLVHCATEFSVGRMGQRAATVAGLPLVSSYHTDWGRYADAYGVPWLRRAVTSHLTRFHARSRRVYTPSSAARRDLAGFGIEAVELWGRGVDTAVFHPGRRSQHLRESLGMGSRFTFVHVGRLAAEKQVDLIVEAFRQALTMVPRGVIHLIIAGTGPCEARLKAAAPPGVTFLGFLDRQTALPDLYANSDAFLFSSVTETLGLVVLEAMASGLPVIAAPEGGVRDHLRDSLNGLSCAAGDAAAMARAMVLLVGEWELTRRLSRAARRTAEALSWERELDRLDASYREVCEDGVAVSAPAGKHARDRRPPAPLALGEHPPAVRLDEVLHDGQA